MVYMRKTKRILSLALCLVMLVGMFPASAMATELESCTHSGGEATCAAQAICQSCGESYGELAEHSYADGICSVCQSADPDYVAPCEHSGGTASCTAQAICQSCGESYGELAEHSYADGICSVCQSADPEYVAPCEHSGGTASCTAQAVCQNCGESYGELADHSYGEDHKCTACSALDPTAEPEVELEETPSCICQDKCALNQVLSECAVCTADHSVCTGEEKTISLEELEALAELFRKLPDASIFDYYVSPEDVENISKDLEAAMTAFNALWDSNSDGALLFEEQYGELVLKAFDLESAILGYDPANYAEGGFDVSYDSSNKKFKITLGNGMDDTAPQVIRFEGGVAKTYEVVKTGNRQYSFADNTNSGSYIITGSAAGYADQQISVAANNSSATLSVKTHSGSTHVLMFYIYSNAIPQPYNGGSTDNTYYGPSGNGTPMLRMEVNLAALSHMEDVVYSYSSATSWYFIPKYDANGNVSIENVRAFWNAVLACTTESGRQALRDTGLYDIFRGYMVKYEWDGTHADGILDVSQLPIYVAELYDNNSYFGSVMGSDGAPKNLVDVLALCDQNLGGTVYWEKQTLAESIGYYYGNNNTVIKVTVKPMDSGSLVTPAGSDIAFVKKSDQHYLARFNMVKQNVSNEFYFDVTYTDGANGEVFSTVNYPVRKQQAIPEYNGNPSREGYSFTGWKCVTEGYTDLKPGAAMPEKDIVFEAQWEINKYTVTWKNADGSVLETDTDVPYRTMPSYDGSTPTRASDAQYSYAFKGWTPAIDYVTSDVVYTAMYEAFVRDYTVTWCDDNGAVLETDHHVPYGTMPSYDGNTPYKPATAQHSYTFTGWSPEVGAVSGDVRYKATYSETVNSYTVRWLDDDGTVLETDENVPYGSIPSYDSENPAKAETDEYTYAFNAWSPAVGAITGDTDYTATYSQTRKEYTVTWLNYDGSTLDTDSVPYGETPAYTGETPSKKDTAQYSYAFSGWTPEISPVTGDQSYTAVFGESVNCYSVTWKYALNKEEIDSDLPYGTYLSFSDSANLNYEAGNYNYIFQCWQLDNTETTYSQEQLATVPVTADMTLTAQYKAELKGHTVKVKVLLDDTTLVPIETVLGDGVKLYLFGFGGKPIALNKESEGIYSAALVPNGQYHIYSSLDDVTALSQYEITVDNADVVRDLYFYSVSYKLNGGSIDGNTADVVQYHRGGVTVDIATPVKDGCTFIGWQLNDTIYQPGDVLTDAIRQPYTLTALWGDAQVNLKVTLRHKYLDKGTDPGSEINVNIELAYRPAGDTDEPYVEVVGAANKTEKIVYSTEKITTEKTFTNIYTGLDNRYDYSANVFATGYEVVSREVIKEGNVYTVSVVLQYRPHMFNLEYTVQMAEGTASDLIPTATDVKVISYVNDNWGPISAHKNSAHDLPFDDKTTATGSYMVPVHDADKNTYYYKVAAVGFTLKDGTELTNDYTLDANNTWTFSSKETAGYPAGAYTAELVFEAAADAIEPQGAYGTDGEPSVQKGTLTLLVTAHPETIVLDYNDGATANGRIENVFSIPQLPVPAARAGYTFKGWYLDEGYTEPAAVGTLLNISDEEPTYLYAKWNKDITVSGKVYVSDIYTFDGKSYKISPDARLSHVTVRVMNDQGLPLKSVSAELSYTDGKDYGEASYEINGIADDGTQYTLSVLQAVGSNYSGVYQNEPESLSAPTTFESYTAEDNIVLTGTAYPLIATVNAYLSFTPHTFDLEYSIDASAIGEAFRPDMSRTLIYADEATNETMSWAVITQMLEGGQENDLSSGKGSWSYPVWQAHADGSLYNYAVRLQELSHYPMGDGKAVTISDFGAQLPFAVTYEPLYTYYVAASSAQKDELTITLSPKAYPIEYVTNGASMPENYKAEHVWSFDTALDAVPEREGYSFQGWYTDASFQAASKIETIPASVAEKTTVYAKWQPIVYRIDYYLGGGTAEGNPNSYTVESDTIVLNAPSYEGFTFLGWTGTNHASYTKVVTIPKGSTGDLSFIAHWEKSRYTIDITVENGTAVPANSVVVTHGDTLSVEFTPQAGFALDSVTVDGETAYLTADGKYTFANVSDNHSIHVIFAEDNNKDGKPDKYQATVTYNVVNGSLAAGIESNYVFDLKTYTNGLWVDAEPKLGDTVPSVADDSLVPNEGYDGRGYWWENISADTPVTGNASYTWEFTGRVLHTVTFPDADRAPNTSGIYPDSITNNILYASMIRVDPNGGQWTSTITGNTETYTSSYDFPLKENIHLGTPSRENYVFCGWRDTAGEGNIAHVYTAQWAPEEYTITYVMPNSILDTPNPYHYTVESESFTLNNPYRPGYVFDGWSGTDIDGKSTNVTITQGSSGHRTYIANWTANTNTPYQIRYYFQNKELKEYVEREDLRKNLTGTTDSAVSIEGSPEFDGFTLNKDKSYRDGTLYGNGSLILYLIYDRNTYTVTWKNGDTVLETDENVPYETEPRYDGTVPAKASTDEFSYTFSGWSPNVDIVTKDISYQAQFTETVNKYTVTWLDYDGQILRKDTLDYGAMPQYGSDPTRESSALFHYIFTGWDTEPAKVTGDAEYTAQYRAEPRLYTGTVRFFVDGSAATTDQMAGSLSDGKTLWLKTDAGTEYHPLTLVSGSSNQYSAQIPVGNYRVYVKDGENYITLSDGYLSIIDQPASVDIHYYTVTYNPGYTEGSINVDYYLKGSAVNVGPGLSREGYGFYGWQLDNALYQEGNVLTDAIRQPYTLTALWGDAQVNLKIIMNPEYRNSSDTYIGKDPSNEVNVGIELTYRPAGATDEQEPYVEVVGVDPKTEKILYSGEKTTTEKIFTNLYTGLDNRYDYSANVFAPGYEVVRRDVVKENNVYTVTVELQFRPHMFDLNYTVQMADGTANELIPRATDVKVISYVDNKWGPISAHKNSAHDLPFGNDATATGSYLVPVHDANENTYYYRVAAVGFTLKDGTELTNDYTLDANNTWTFSSKETAGYPAGAYTAELVFAPVGDAIGAYGTEGKPSVQKGTLTLKVNAHPASLTLNLNYDDAPSYETIENIFAVPNLSQYVPERPGFTFLGWYTDATCETQALSGTVLEAGRPVTYYAKWAENLTIEGSVEASNYYDGKLLVEGDRLTSLVITLHKNDNSKAQVGLPQTVNLEKGTEKNTGVYSFENVPNDGSEYYIAVSALGYEALFQNEESTDFTSTANNAVDKDGNFKAQVNVSLSFAPHEFDLHWKIDASQLGENFRPNNAPVFIMGDTEHGEGYKWEVITQMRTEDDVENPASAAGTTIGENGTGTASYKVWQFSPHGHAYNYAIRIASMDVDLNGNGTIEDSEKLAVPSNKNYRDEYKNLPFRVQYVYPAYYKLSTNAQDTLLTATLIPNTYTVTLDPNGGTLTMKNGSVNPASHTWSHDTQLDFSLTRDGYVFEGWFDQNGVRLDYAGAEGAVIPAAVQENISLTAQWTKISSLSFSAEDIFGVYDGSVQSGGNELISSDLPEGYRFEGVKYSVEGTNVGDHTGKFESSSIRIFNGDKDVTAYFDVANAKFTPGVLVISPKLVTVTAKDISKVYDKEAVSAFEYTVDGIVNNEDIGLEVSYHGDAVGAIDVGSYTITPSVTITNSNYYTAVESGTLTISPKAVTVSIEAKDKPYDQNNIAQADIILDGVVQGDILSAEAESICFTSSDVVRDADGNVINQLVTAHGIVLYGNDKGNYKLDISNSTLSDDAAIKPLSLELLLFPVSREYNGSKELAVTASEPNPLPGDTVIVLNCPTTATMDTADVGNNKQVFIPVEALSAMELSGDDAVNYNLTYTLSTVDITRRNVTLRSASAEKTFDGIALTAPEVYIDKGSFVAGEVSNIRAEASLLGNKDTDSSVTNNPISFDKADGVNMDNYSITYIYGTLTVRADKNGNKIPDSLESVYTVTYLASPEHTDLEQDVVIDGLLIGMPIPSAPSVVADKGYKLGNWTLLSGTEGADGTLSTTDLVYELTTAPELYPISYVLEDGAVNNASNPANYTYGIGVGSFAAAAWEGHVFMGWFSDSSHLVPITAVSADSTGEIILYPKWMDDSNKDGIPDEYQRTVFYRVENGSWADDTTDDKSHIFNLRELKDGKWEEVTATLGSTIPSGMKPGEGYKAESGKWSEAISADTIVSANATYIYSFGEKHTYTITVTVTGGTAKYGEADYSAPITVEHGDKPTFSFAADSGRILDIAQIRAAGSENWTDISLTDGSYTLDAVTTDMQINVSFSIDQWNDEEDVLDNPDNIPDTRQALFVFRSEDDKGTVSGKTTQVVTIEKDSAGNYVASIAPETVTVQAAQGYKLKNWTRDDTECDPFAAIEAQGGSSYIFTAHFEADNKTVAFLNAEDLVELEPQADSVTVQSYKKVKVDPNGGTWRNSSDVQILTITADKDLLTPSRSGYLFMGWLCEAVSEDDIVYCFTAQWLADSQEDGIPDKYQKKITFSIENGVWGYRLFRANDEYAGTDDDIIVYLVLKDADGNLSETGSADLKPYIPTRMQPNDGYYNGHWLVEPPETVTGNNSVKYSYCYELIPSTGPKTGDDSDMNMWLGLMSLSLLSSLALGFPLIKNKKKRSK